MYLSDALYSSHTLKCITRTILYLVQDLTLACCKNIYLPSDYEELDSKNVKNQVTIAKYFHENMKIKKKWK